MSDSRIRFDTVGGPNLNRDKRRHAHSRLAAGQIHGRSAMALVFVLSGGLWWGLLAVVVALFYLWTIRPPRCKVATGFLWRRVLPAGARPWRRRRVWSLAMQLVVLAAIVLAAADPRTAPPRQLVVIVDNSPSMAARDVFPSRLQEAKRLAERLANSLQSGETMSVWTTCPMAHCRLDLTGRKSTVKEIIAGIAMGRGPNAVVQAVDGARRMLAGRRGGRIVVLSDGGFRGAGELAAAKDVELVFLGRGADNWAVSRLAARRSPLEPERCQILAEVTSYASRPMRTQLELLIAGEPVGICPVTVEPHGRWRKVFQITAKQGGPLCARLAHHDALDDDNQLTVSLLPAYTQRVLAVGPLHPTLEAALEANSSVTWASAEQLPAESPPGTTMLLHRRVPDALPPGRILVVDPEGDCQLWNSRPLEEAELVAGQIDGDPLVENISLVGLHPGRIRAIRPAAAARSFASTVAWTAGNRPVVLAFRRKEGPVVVFGFDLDTSDVVEHAVWPVLLSNALDWLAGWRPAADVENSSAEADELPAQAEIFGASRPAEESDLRLPPAAGRTSSQLSFHGPAPWWPCLVMGAVVLAVAEWCLFHRRWIC